ncbi:MAG: hypothetical protein Q8O70_01425, partial [Burkholderiales bacterium]|nr:hypothetical protein [Burkholderiales bacterium]
MLDRNVSKWFRAIGAIAFALGLIGPAPAAQPAGGTPGPEVCKSCHADQYESYIASSMSVKSDPRTPGAQGGCVVCHTANGDGSAHVKAGGGRGVGGIINPGSKTLAAEEKNKICLTCHK